MPANKHHTVTKVRPNSKCYWAETKPNVWPNFDTELRPIKPNVWPNFDTELRPISMRQGLVIFLLLLLMKFVGCENSQMQQMRQFVSQLSVYCIEQASDHKVFFVRSVLMSYSHWQIQV